MFAPSKRLQALPPYVFLELQQMRDRAREAGADVVDLTVGNPNGPVPVAATDELARCIREEPEVHRYPPFRGHPALREATARWYQRRFGVTLDPAREVLPVLGSKEGLFHLMQAFLDPGDAVLVPTPCYPAYLGAARLCGAEVLEVPLLEEHDFRLRVADIDSDAARAARMLLVNYPHNPTGALGHPEDDRDLVAFARDHDILLVSDLPYSELALEEDVVPHSMLETPGAHECCIELQSLSKSHSMAGWRVGLAIGNAAILDQLAKLKSNSDFGMFAALQLAAAKALDEGDATVAATRALYRGRRDRLCEGLAAIGWQVRRPRASMYVWTRIPEHFGSDDRRFVEELFERSHVLLSPGSGFGESGRGYVRFSLVVDEAVCDEVARRIAESGVLDASSSSR